MWLVELFHGMLQSAWRSVWDWRYWHCLWFCCLSKCRSAVQSSAVYIYTSWVNWLLVRVLQPGSYLYRFGYQSYCFGCDNIVLGNLIVDVWTQWRDFSKWHRQAVFFIFFVSFHSKNFCHVLIVDRKNVTVNEGRQRRDIQQRTWSRDITVTWSVS